MSTLPEKFSATGQSQLEAQLNFFQNFAAKAVESTEKVLALNLATTRASMEQSTAAVQQLFTVRDPRDLLSLGAQTRQQIEGMLAYGRALAGIASGTQAALMPAVADVAKSALPPLSEQRAPVAKTAEPIAQTAEPVAQAAEPVAQTAKPVAKTAEPVAKTADPVAKTADPVAQTAPAPAQFDAAPTPEPEFAPEVKVEPEPLVARSAPAAPPAARVTPIAKAVTRTASKAAPAKPAAAPVPAAGKKVVVTNLKAVEASPPPRKAKAETKQQELLPTKAKKKK